jgi:erythromycin esterase-like protein
VPRTDLARLDDAILPVTGAPADYDPLLDRIGDARVVLLGEASHGTHEFYRERCRITRLLVERKGFDAVAVEADWPDAYRVNRYVRGMSDDRDADAALGGFQRFPTWMWRNRDVVELVDWLRAHNDALGDGAPTVGFYGLDLYSLHASIQAVLEYLDTVDPEAAARARYRYGCFDHFGEDPQAYGYAASIGASRGCEDEVVQQLAEMQRRATELAAMDGRLPEGEHFFAEQNARLVRNAERYYRSMFRGREESWNLRDRHMADTLDALLAHLGRKPGREEGTATEAGAGRPARIVVWEHNSHIGDARATQMGAGGELNVGQLARERHADDAVLVGFTTYSGTVTAARDWGSPALLRRVRPGLDGSWEALFHEADSPDFLLPLWIPRVRDALPDVLLERAIGVIYRPETERVSHYFRAHLARQFDAVLHFDRTHAVEPIEPTPEWERGEPPEVPETYPTGL